MTEPAQTIDPPARPRCRGHCCHAFNLQIPGGTIDPELLQQMGEFARRLNKAVEEGDREEGSRIYDEARDRNIPLTKDADKVADMAIPLGMFTRSPASGLPLPFPTHFYACKHLQPNGDCGNYENRPLLCRSYGREGWPCEHALCARKPLLTDSQHKP